MTSSSIADLAGLIRSGRLSHTTLVDGSGVVLNADTLEILTLNEAANLVFNALAEGVTDEDPIVDRLVAAFEVDRDTAAADLATYFANLHDLVQGPTPTER